MIKLTTVFLIACLSIVFIISASNVSAGNMTAELLLANGSTIDHFRYDLANESFGSNSYMDHSPTNPNLYLNICNDNLSSTEDQRIDLVYTSESGNITTSVLNFLPEPYQIIIDNATGTKCTKIDVDISSTNALYPGYIAPRIYYPKNTTYTINQSNTTITITNQTMGSYDYPYLSEIMNGSYKIKISVDGPTHTYYLSVGEIYDEYGHMITTKEPKLILSLVNATNQSMVEGLRAPSQSISYHQGFTGGEKVYVNGIKSLEVKIYNPCDPINESGYYILNKSAWNENKSCIRIINSSGLVMNFGGELVDGDGLANGSMQNDSEHCAVYIENSKNITLEYMKVQEFTYGICVKNSKVAVFGDDSVSNVHGAWVYDNSSVNLINVYIHNNNTDLKIENNSLASLYNVSFDTARIKADVKDVIMRGVSNHPPKPDPDILDIEQWIQVIKNGVDAYAQLNFHYSTPLPNYVVADNLTVWEYNGTYSIPTIVTNGTNGTNQTTQNGTTPQWHSGNWTQLYTLISPSEQLIIAPLLHNFSVFAPYGFETNPEEVPVPKPVPRPVPEPEAGAGSGQGGTPIGTIPGEVPISTLPEPIIIKLQLPDNITLQQGQAGEVNFNISNVGDADAFNVTVSPKVLSGWDSTNYTFAELLAGNDDTGAFQIAPYEKATPKEYLVPVSVNVMYKGIQITVTREILKVIVLPRTNIARMKILEFPPVIQMEPYSKLDVSFLAKNIGDKNLDGIDLKLESNGDCVTKSNALEQSMVKGETKLLSYSFQSGGAESCEYNLKFYSGDKLVGFAPIKFVVSTQPWTESPNKVTTMSILLVILAIWTMLTVWIFTRRRN